MFVKFPPLLQLKMPQKGDLFSVCDCIISEIYHYYNKKYF